MYYLSAKNSPINWLFLLAVAECQTSNMSRNCTQNEIAPRPNQLSYLTRNATGSFDFKGFADPNSNQVVSPWIWSMGVQNVWNFTNNLTFWYQQPVWLDTHGVNLASDKLGYEICYLTLSDYPLSAQRRGQGDNGDCTKFYNQQCVDDWRKALVDQGLRYMNKNSTDRESPCKALRQFTPDSCKDFKSGTRAWGDIPLQNRSCPLGLGSPDYDVVLQSSRFASDAAAKNNTADFSVYDEMVTGIVPVFALAWSENATVQWSDARIMCLSTPNITDGSRKPSGVPNSSTRLSFSLLIALGSVMFWIIIC